MTARGAFGKPPPVVRGRKPPLTFKFNSRLVLTTTPAIALLLEAWEPVALTVGEILEELVPDASDPVRAQSSIRYMLHVNIGRRWMRTAGGTYALLPDRPPLVLPDDNETTTEDRTVCVACRNLLTPTERARRPDYLLCDVCGGGPLCDACYGYPEQDCPLCGMNESEVCGDLPL